VNLPNRLTLLRILLVPLILLFMLPLPQLAALAGWNRWISEQGNGIAFVLFAIAALTDLLDGRLARKMNLVTDFGKFLDPMADKMLVVSVLAALVQQNRLHVLAVIIVVFREFIITGVRLAASGKGVVIAASNLGKAKTVSQIIAILVILSERYWISLARPVLAPDWIVGAGDVLLWFSVLLTLISGVDYLVKNSAVWKA
jgi:CDP-diacylglycerol---glycerol-3-phosphate 3-phosphatidyltransferase